jgi:hypothetical protein
MTERFEIAYGTSWKFRRRSWMRKSMDVGIYLPKSGVMIYMMLIAGR